MNEAGMRTKFADCRALKELPYFYEDADGRLKLDPALGLKIIDAHTHIALSWFLRGKIDLWKETPEVFHNFPARGNPIDLQNYGHNDLTERNDRMMRNDLVGACFWGSERAPTHTIPNLLREMDDMNVSHSLVMAIKVRFLFDINDVVLDAVKDVPRLVPFCCLHPAAGRFEELLERHVAKGARGVKFHPVFQMIAPDDDRSLKLFAACARYGLPILSHTSASGSEPAFMGKYAKLRRFAPAVKAARDVPFILGHSGMGDQYREAVDLAARYENVYLEVSGQPIDNLKLMFEKVSHDRILFGTDWPFYPMAFQLAKVLIATEGDESLREKVLYGNAARLMGLTEFLTGGHERRKNN